MLARTAGAEAEHDWTRLVARPDVDLVIVATTNDALVPVTLAAISAGKHVLVEKPAARSSAELQPVIAAATRAGVRVRVGFNHRYHPGLSKTRELVNAGTLGPREPIIHYPVPAWEKVVKANLTAVFLVTREALGVMARQKEGVIINLSSGVGRIGKARWGAYAAAKFGVEGLTQVVAEEVKEWNIRVNAVNPGGTRTEMRAEAYPDEEPTTLPTPEEIAPIFVYLASDESREISGKSFDARDWRKI